SLIISLCTQSKCNCWDGQRSITWIGTGRAISRSLVDTEDNVGNEEACELVNGVEISIGEDGDGDGDDTINAYLCTAIKNNNGTGIVLDFAYRVACNGYKYAWIANQDPDRIAKDIATSAKWMSDEFLAAGISKKLGLIGFCYGGGRVVEVLSKGHGFVHRPSSAEEDKDAEEAFVMLRSWLNDGLVLES
ncbi:hypothetical protein LINPERPRIM_LOCUS22228, partial [Linum perenne]